MTVTQERAIQVLQRMIKLCEEDDSNAQMFCDTLEPLLDDLHSQDAFGTEGRCDPRGDFRNGEWSMYRVEGCDDSQSTP